MNYVKRYIKAMADHNPWVRIPVGLLACVGITLLYIGNLWGLLIFIVTGLSYAAAGNYYKW